MLPLLQDGLRSAEMHIGGCQQTDGAVVMFVVVPAEEFSAEVRHRVGSRTGLGNRADTSRF